MSETQRLLARITALRQRLEQVRGLSKDAAALLEQVQAGDEHDVALEGAVRPLTGARPDGTPPQALTARARRVLEHGRTLLGQLRQVADVLLGEQEAAAPLISLYRDTVAMIDTTLRTVALLPDSATAQMQLCRGLEVTLEEVAARVRTFTGVCQRQRQEEEQIQRLSAVLVALHAEKGGPGVPPRLAVDSADLRQLAAEVLAEASACVPLGFLSGDPADVPRFVACHSLTTARVLARVIRHDPELRTRAHEAVLVALLHDVGMLNVPAEVLANAETLPSEQRRLVEEHALLGAQRLTRLFPETPWLSEAVAGHHERLDGSGYPGGLKGMQVRAMPRLLAVCDVYAALCGRRPHRPARSTRTALADTLLLAEQGQLDHHYSECLLALSFYPVGSVVELTDGAVGVVVATPGARQDLNSPARPVVALLIDPRGEPLSRPHHLDLSISDGISIVRALSADERLDLLGRRFLAWAA